MTRLLSATGPWLAGTVSSANWREPDADPFRESDYCFEFFDDAYDADDGPGWYWWSVDYSDEGVLGPFDTRDEAVSSARKFND